MNLRFFGFGAAGEHADELAIIEEHEIGREAAEDHRFDIGVGGAEDGGEVGSGGVAHGTDFFGIDSERGSIFLKPAESEADVLDLGGPLILGGGAVGRVHDDVAAGG